MLPPVTTCPEGGRGRLRGLLVAALAGCCVAEPTPSRVEGAPGGLEPVDLSGSALDPLASAETPVTVLFFLGTSCPISNRYAPTIRNLHETYAARGVGFYLVYPDPADTAEIVARHVREHGLPGVPVRDPGHQLVARAQVEVTPEAAVFGAVGKRVTLAYRGRIDDRVRGYGQIAAEAGERDVADAVSAVLAGLPVPTPETEAIGCPIAELR